MTEGRPRLWFALLLVGVHGVLLVYSLQASTLMQRSIGIVLAPLLVMVILVVWWMRQRSVSLRQRLWGLGLFAAVLGWVGLTQGSDTARLLTLAAPVLTTGIVGLLLLTSRTAWPVARRWVVVWILGCAAFFTALRVDGVRGDLSPIVSWRWTPTPEEVARERLRAASPSAAPVRMPVEPGGGDWPGFRGAARDNRVVGVRFSTDWSDRPPRELWRRAVGLGWSSLTVVGDYLFTQEQRGTNEVVSCYRADTGDPVWVNEIAERFDDAMGSGPRATPTFHQGKLFTLGATGIVQALDAATGETIWHRDLRVDSAAEIPVWGFASSPLVIGENVVVFSGGGDGKGVVAYEVESGRPAWFSGDGSHAYSSGHLARIAQVPQVLMASDVGVQSFAPANGDLLWEHRWPIKTNPRCVQPLVADGRSVLIGTAGGKGTRRLRVERQGGAWSVEEQWTSRGLKPYFNDFVCHRDYCYGFDGSRLTCIDNKTGERRWKGGRYGGQVLLLADMDTLLVLSEKGEVILVEAGPHGHNEIARFKALDGKTWNHPVIARGKLFVRNSQEAACFELPV